MVPKVTAWQCPQSEALFVSKEAYRYHLKKIARARLDYRRMAKIRAERTTKLAAFRERLMDIRDLEAHILENQRLLWDAARTNMSGFSFGSWKNIPTSWYPVVERIVFNVRYSEMVSNSHSAPLTGVTNWGGRTPGAPCGYPGYSGSVEWWTRFPTAGRPSGVDDHIAGSLFSDRLVGIYTGTGGGGGRGSNGLVHYRYGTEIFLDDWDRLRKVVFLKKLAGKCNGCG